MSSLFAPSDILTALSCRVDDPQPEDRLRPGTHLRVFAGLGGSFPLAPFIVRPVRVREQVLTVVLRPGRDGDMVGDFSYLDSRHERTVDIRITDGDGSPVTLLDRRGRDVVSADSSTPVQLFPGRHGRLRLPDAAGQLGFRRGVLNVDDLLNAGDLVQTAPGKPVYLGLPAAGLVQHPCWYAPYDSPDTAWERVRRGASQFLNRMDRPAGELDRIDDEAQAQAEVDRLDALLAKAAGPGDAGPGVLKLLAGLIGDPAPPWQQVEKLDLGVGAGGLTRQRALLPRLAALQIAAMDPAVAHYLGFAEALPNLGLDSWTQTLAVIGVVAIDPALVDRAPHLASWLTNPPAGEDILLERYLQAVDKTGLRGPIQDAIKQATQAHMFVRTVAAATTPLPPWNRPALPEPVLREHRWQPSDGQQPSGLYRASFAFPEVDGVVLAAVGRTDASGEVMRVNGSIDVPSPPSPSGDRGEPLTFGRENDPTDRVRDLMTPGAGTSLAAAAILADENVPAGDGRVRYGFSASDVFGRFGDSVFLDVEPPPRPPPPPPVLRHGRTALDQLPDPDDDGPLSPGTVTLETVVPDLTQLAAGSLPITEIWLDEVAHPVTPGPFRTDIVLAPIGRHEHVNLKVAVAFRDSGGRCSEPVSLAVTAYDRRPPKPLSTGFGLFWTSTPGPAPDVEVALIWTTRAYQSHRVYLIDQTGVRQRGGGPLTEPEDGRPPSRAVIADRGAKGAPLARERFRLLTPDVVADAAGNAVLRARLPRSLWTVQFLRIVPVSERGAETPFDACGLVPIAVPDELRALPPRLEGRVGPDGHAEVCVIADALDTEVLRAAQPPRFRLRRAVARTAPIPGTAAAAPHASYARAAEDGEGPLKPSKADFRGEYRSPHPLEPFVRYVYWADVRMPPEQRVVEADVVPAQVRALHPADETDRQRPGSLFSPPLTLVRYPPDAPAAPDFSRISVNPDSAADVVRLVFADPPRAHEAAIGPYRLAAWYQIPGWTIMPATQADGEWPVLGTTMTVSLSPWGQPAGTSGALKSAFTLSRRSLLLAYVDPAGRMGAIGRTEFLLL